MRTRSPADWEPDQGLESVLFVECQGPTEKNREAQEGWVTAAIEEGVSVSSIAVAKQV